MAYWSKDSEAVDWLEHRRTVPTILEEIPSSPYESDVAEEDLLDALNKEEIYQVVQEGSTGWSREGKAIADNYEEIIDSS